MQGLRHLSCMDDNSLSPSTVYHHFPSTEHRVRTKPRTQNFSPRSSENPAYETPLSYQASLPAFSLLSNLNFCLNQRSGWYSISCLSSLTSPTCCREIEWDKVLKCHVLLSCSTDIWARFKVQTTTELTELRLPLSDYSKSFTLSNSPLLIITVKVKL